MRKAEQDEAEDDYMSDKFLQSEQKPGLMPKLYLDRHKRNELAASSKKTKRTPAKQQSVKVKEHENRKVKLDQALDESNKGFAMLAKMGFKKGMGLGKEGQGRSEPIPLEFRAGRSGLGKDLEEERKRKKRLELYALKAKRRKETEKDLRVDFKSRMRSKLNERQIFADLSKSQKACEQLDSQKGILEPVQIWYWPKKKKIEETDEVDEEEDEEEEDSEDESEKLLILTSYLRDEHFYCIWCGIKFNDDEDLKSNCPGDTFEEHQD